MRIQDPFETTSITEYHKGIDYWSSICLILSSSTCAIGRGGLVDSWNKRIELGENGVLNMMWGQTVEPVHEPNHKIKLLIMELNL